MTRPRLRLLALRPIVLAGHRIRLLRGLAHRISDGAAGSKQPVHVVSRLASGSRMLLDLRDHAHRHIFIHGELDAGISRLFRRTLVPGDVVLDVGANAGYYSLLAADLGLVVHAFEPQAKLAAMLRKSASGRVTVVEAACGSVAGERKLFESMDPAFGGMASLIERRYTISCAEGVLVAVIVLDDYCRANALHPRLVKIDVEGFEAEVVAGLRETLSRARPTVVCEVSFGGGHEAEVLDLFSRFGYRAQAITDTGELVELADTPTGEVNLDLCFVSQ